MVVTYTTSDKVGNELGFPNGFFNTTSTPTKLVVENLINRAEDRIDNTTSHSWRPKTINKEYPRPSSVYRYGTGIRLDLIHRSIQSITSIEIFENNDWNDWVSTKEEGRNKDYWIDKENGIVYLQNILRIYPHGVRITYVFGEENVSGGIEDCATLMVALKILNSPEFSVVLFTQAGENPTNREGNKRIWKEEIASILSNNTEFQ